MATQTSLIAQQVRIRQWAERFAFLADSEKLTDNERSKYRAIIHLVNGKYSMDEDMLVSSLQTLSWLGCEIKQGIWRWFCGYSA